MTSGTPLGAGCDVAKQARREREEEDKDKSHKKEKSVGGEIGGGVSELDWVIPGWVCTGESSLKAESNRIHKSKSHRGQRSCNEGKSGSALYRGKG